VVCVAVLPLIPGTVLGSDILEQKFDGIVVPRLWVQVVPQVDGRPRVAPGAFVEATAGTVLAEIAQLDPILVSFYVPYVERQRAFDKAGTSTASEIFQRSMPLTRTAVGANIRVF
jgi:hypothetical protein